MSQITTSTEVRVDLRIYPLLAVQKTIAALSPRCVTEIAQDNEVSVRLTLRARLDAPALADSGAVFMSLLSDFALQDKVADQTKDIRAALVRAAFFEALSPPK